MTYNKNFDKRRIKYGFCQILDGIITILTVGKAQPSFSYNWMREELKRKVKEAE